MTWNSTHTALITLTAIIIAGFHYQVDLQLLLPLITPIGAYIALRERSRINGGESARSGESQDLSGLVQG